VIRLDPKNALAYFSRGAAFNEMKDYDRAISNYNEAIRIDPGIAGPYYYRPRLYFKARQALLDV
jgi:tetratricopeptide (TPR) repeat protein